jgi:hypothetical protein
MVNKMCNIIQKSNNIAPKILTMGEQGSRVQVFSHAILAV